MPSFATRVAAETLRLLPRKGLSRGLGRVASTGASRALLDRAIAAYVRAYDVDMNDAVVPPGGFRTFDEFFTRALRPGARSLAGDERTVVSPADGKVESAGPIRAGSTFRVKDHDYSVNELLGEHGGRFEAGRYAIVYLSPRDYHRVHAPVTGVVRAARHVGGTLLPVNAFGVRAYPNLFARNERVVVFQRTEVGEVATIMVGAVGVGRISLSFDPTVMTNVGRAPTTVRYDDGSAPHLARGDELGQFHLGSTAIVLTTPEVGARLDVEPGQIIRMGAALARTREREDS